MQPASIPFDRFEDSEDILSMIERCIREAAREIGTVNILIAGRTGVGKSTLINEVFQGRLATTGQGKPVTKETRRVHEEGHPAGDIRHQGAGVEGVSTDHCPVTANIGRQHRAGRRPRS